MCAHVGWVVEGALTRSSRVCFLPSAVLGVCVECRVGHLLQVGPPQTSRSTKTGPIQNGAPSPLTRARRRARPARGRVAAAEALVEAAASSRRRPRRARALGADEHARLDLVLGDASRALEARAVALVDFERVAPLVAPRLLRAPPSSSQTTLSTTRRRVSQRSSRTMSASTSFTSASSAASAAAARVARARARRATASRGRVIEPLAAQAEAQRADRLDGVARARLAATITAVLAAPPSPACSSRVSLLSWYGTNAFLARSASTQRLSANSPRLMFCASRSARAARSTRPTWRSPRRP